VGVLWCGCRCVSGAGVSRIRFGNMGSGGAVGVRVFTWGKVWARKAARATGRSRGTRLEIQDAVRARAFSAQRVETNQKGNGTGGNEWDLSF